jgi:hypothetical protein
MAKKRQRANGLYSPDGEKGANYNSFMTQYKKEQKEFNARFVRKDVMRTDTIGETLWKTRSPYGAGSRGISPRALRHSAENAQNNADYEKKKSGRNTAKNVKRRER